MKITEKIISTPRLAINCLVAGKKENPAILLLHGNFSSAIYWQPLLQQLHHDYYLIAPDLRGYGKTQRARVDATQGARDWSLDLQALLTTLGISQTHVVGWSLGGAVAMQMAWEVPALISSVILICPVSPYGFGGTRGIEGLPLPEFVGAGGGAVSPEFVQRIRQQDLTQDSPHSPRNIIKQFYFRPPFCHPMIEEFLAGSLLQDTSEFAYPGDAAVANAWPNFGPGKWGAINAVSGKYFNMTPWWQSAHKAPVLWVRGDSDLVVSDNSLFDMGFLGQMGYIPGWPGAEQFPPQPMVSQTRYFFQEYTKKGGFFQEVVIANTAHSPHLEQPEAFYQQLKAWVK